MVFHGRVAPTCSPIFFGRAKTGIAVASTLTAMTALDNTPGSTGAGPQRRGPRRSFITEQWVPYPVTTVFAFFSDPSNLPRLMPRWQDARIDSAELVRSGEASLPQAADRGSRILLSFRPVPLSPVRLRWLAIIDDFEVNQRFCDLQVTGPFGYWRHCHIVAPERHGDVDGTRITDAVDYDWPLRPLSPFMDMVFGRLQIRAIFRYRQQQLLKLLRS